MRSGDDERWRAALSASFSGLEPESLDSSMARGSISEVGLGNVDVYEVKGTRQILRRRGRVVRKEPTDRLKICLQVRGTVVLHQGDVEVSAGPGQFAFYDLSRPYSLRFNQPWTAAVLSCPRDVLGLNASETSVAMERAHRADVGTGAILAGFMRDAVTHAARLERREHADRLGTAGLHLLEASVAGGSPSLSPPEQLVAQVRIYVRQNLTDPHLCPAGIAANFHVSVRTLQRCMAAEGQGVRELIRTLRLRALHRELSDPRLSGHTISALAARWCLTDASHLNHQFHAAFGMAPSDVRNRAQWGTSG